MMTTKLNLLLGLAAVTAATALADAQIPAAAPAPAATPAPAVAPAPAATAAPTAAPAAAPGPKLSAYDKWEKDAKNPTPHFNWGADLRLRNEYLNSAITLNDGSIRHEQDYFRFRERIWAAITPTTNVSLNARLAAEQREWMKPSFASQYGARSGFEERYGIIDNLYAKWNNIADLPLSVSVGRQDIQFGDTLNWWLVGDGTPGDGSWTFFLDSARINYDVKNLKTKVDVVYAYQSARPDAWMPTFGSARSTYATPYNLTEQNEQAVILYLSNKWLKNAQVDGYFIYKHDDREFANGDNADIYTVGAKVTGTPCKNVTYSLEGAVQGGSKQDPTVVYPTAEPQWRRISAYGFNGKTTYLCKDELNNQFSLAFEYLSGDDPTTTDRDEMFDILWGRWPRTSELYIYSYIYETSGKVAQLNNLIRFGPTWTCNPIKNMTLSATYNALFAPQDTPTRRIGPAAGAFTYSGDFRGHFMQTFVKHKFNEHISAHLWAELVWMGDYYVKRDMMSFLRAEVMLTF
jgi:hypothetical protein